MTMRTSGSGLAAGCIVTPSSTSAPIATGGIAIAALSAVTRPVWINAAAPTSDISEAKKDGSIIATGNAPTGIAGGRQPA